MYAQVKADKLGQVTTTSASQLGMIPNGPGSTSQSEMAEEHFDPIK
jgi:hypothetical protein